MDKQVGLLANSTWHIICSTSHDVVACMLLTFDAPGRQTMPASLSQHHTHAGRIFGETSGTNT